MTRETIAAARLRYTTALTNAATRTSHPIGPLRAAWASAAAKATASTGTG